jgi:(2Fe-2S) ferredoxin
VNRSGERLCIVRACRDCCCGSEAKHPGVDHDGLLARLETGTRGRARVLRSACLLACDESNVVVVSPSPIGRSQGGRAVWLRRVLDAAAVDAVALWVRRGGPGVVPPPDELAASVFAPSSLSVTYAPAEATPSGV